MHCSNTHLNLIYLFDNTSLFNISLPYGGFPGGASGKEFACNAENSGDVGLIPGSGRPPGGEHSSPLQYSCLENSMDRGAWWAAVQELDMTEVTEQAHIVPYEVDIIPFIDEEDVFEQQFSLRPE